MSYIKSTRYITYYPNGNKFIEEFRINGVRGTRDIDDLNEFDDPYDAVTVYDVNGMCINIMEYNPRNQIDLILYYINGLSHNDYGPAYITWYYYGDTITSLRWSNNNQYHNVTGPAYMSFTAVRTNNCDDYYYAAENQAIFYRTGQVLKHYTFGVTPGIFVSQDVPV